MHQNRVAWLANAGMHLNFTTQQSVAHHPAGRPCQVVLYAAAARQGLQGEMIGQTSLLRRFPNQRSSCAAALHKRPDLSPCWSLCRMSTGPMGACAQVALQLAVRAIPLAGLSLLILPLPWTLPRLMALQATLPIAVLEGGLFLTQEGCLHLVCTSGRCIWPEAGSGNAALPYGPAGQPAHWHG